jgi:hypothetical protein
MKQDLEGLLRDRVKKVPPTHPSRQKKTPSQKRHRALAVLLSSQKAKIASPKGSAGAITATNSTPRSELFKLNPKQNGAANAPRTSRKSDPGTAKIHQYRIQVASRYPL